MWINRVELENIKSYGPATAIELTAGVNAICGQNGAGKSTILEAIGLALFGQSSYKNQEQLINVRAKQGTITITLIDSRDDRPYQIVRPLKKGGSPYVYDPETQRQVASGVSDVQNWLRDCLGVEAATDLKALFEHAIGVPQGMLTAAFLLNNSPRKGIFDPLLGVEDYEKVFKEMRPVVGEVKAMIANNEKKQERRAGKLEALPTRRDEAQALTETIQQAEAKLQQVDKSLADLSEQLAQLQAQEERIRELEGKIEPLAERRRGLQAQLKKAKADLEAAKQAQAEVTRSEAGYQAYEQAQAERAALEEQRKERDEIRERLGDCERTVGLVQQAIDSIEKQLEAVAEAEANLIEIQPFVEKQESLEQERKAAEKGVADLRAAEKRVDDEQERLQKLQNELAEVQAQVARREALQEEIEGLQKQRDELTGELEVFDRTISDLDTQLETVRQELQAAQSRLNEYENLQEKIDNSRKALDKRRSELNSMEADIARRSDLEQALQKLGESRAARKADLASLEKQIGEQESGQQQIQTTLNEWRTRAQQLENSQSNLAAAEKRLAAAETEVARLEAGVAERETVAARIEGWEAEQGAANTQRDALKDDLSRAEARLGAIDEATAALQVEADTPCPVCRKPLSAHDMADLDTHYRQEREGIEADRAQADNELKQTEKSLKQLKRQIKRARADVEQLPTPAQLKKQQDTVSTYRDEVTDLETEVADLAEAPTQVKKFEAELREIQVTLAELKQQQSGLRADDETDATRQSDLQTEISRLPRQADIDRLAAEMEQGQRDLAQWQTEAEALSDAPQQVDDLKAREMALSQDKADQRAKREQVNDDREDLATSVLERQTEMGNLAPADRVAEIEAEIEAQQQTLAAWQEKVTGLSQAPARLEGVTETLTALDDPRSKQQAAQVEADKRPQLEADHSEKQTELERKQAEQKGIEAELQPFADLEQAFEKVDKSLAETGAAHQTYLENRATAETVPQRAANVADIEQTLAAVAKAQTALEADLKAENAAYDPDQHQQVQQDEKERQTRQTELKTQLKNDRQQLARLQKKISDLEKVEAELEELKQAGARLEELQSTVEFIRRTIRDAGPEVTKRLVKAVSLRADDIFTDIMKDHQQSLEWDETYAVTVRRDGYERDFQQLSGGEAMAAALAVRLALLQSMSAIDVAFFDEPTANLDPERRAGLAEQMARIRGFSQLVIISHDDTFEQDTGHVIHIGRDEAGYSQVVA